MFLSSPSLLRGQFLFLRQLKNVSVASGLPARAIATALTSVLQILELN